MAHLNLTRRPRPQGDWRRLGDLVIAGALIALSLPLICIVALAIKCDSQGPVFARLRPARTRVTGTPFCRPDIPHHGSSGCG